MLEKLVVIGGTSRQSLKLFLVIAHGLRIAGALQIGSKLTRNHELCQCTGEL